MIRFDYRELSALSREQKKTARAVLASARRTLRSASFAVEKRVKAEMPVDTGRARASWGHWTPDGLAAEAEASAGDAHWEETDDGLTITQGSNLPYIEALNNGHSRKAPAGFIDSAQLHGQLELEKALGLIDPLDPNLAWLDFA